MYVYIFNFLFHGQVRNETQRHYKKVCHLDCEEVPNAELNVTGHPELSKCFVVDRETQQCLICRCNFSSHLWIDYETMIKEDFVTDEDITKQIAEKENLLRSSMDVIDSIQRSNWEWKKEQDSVKDVCYKLASFIRQYSIIPFNHSYGEYVDQCIRRLVLPYYLILNV